MIPRADAQNIYSGNPADMDVLESTFSNPALNAYTRDRLALALTSHQTGVAGRLFSIRSGIIGYHFPWQLRGIALGIQYMQAGLYSQNNLRISYGRRAVGPVALGANLDIFNRAFDRDQFYMFDPNDPVFRYGYSKWGTSFGFGVAVIPYHSLVFGLSVEHINRPDLAMGMGYVPQPVLLSTGFKLYLDNFSLFSSVNALEFFGYNHESLTIGRGVLWDQSLFGMEIPFYGHGLLRFSTGARAIAGEFEAYVYKNLYFNYRYEYPLTEINLASGGTHRFGLLFDFWRQPPLPLLNPLPEIPKYHAEVTPKSVRHRGQFFIYSNSDSVMISTRRVRRTVDKNVPHYSLGLLFPEDLGDACGLSVKTPKHLLALMEVRDPTILPKELYSTGYRGALEGISLNMVRSNVPTEVVAYPGAERRGNELANQITGNFTAVSATIPIYAPDSAQTIPERIRGLMGNDEVQRLIQPETAEVMIVPIHLSNYHGKWWMEVRTSRDSTIFSQSGEGAPPDTVRWNWKDRSGDYAPPGVYYFIFKSLGEDGTSQFSARQYFKVYHQHRTLDLAISRESRIGEIDADKYIIILHGKPGNESALQRKQPQGINNNKIQSEDLND
jgi:hypothetical protein